MDRRDFVKGTALAGLLTMGGPGFLSRAVEAAPRGPSGQPLGPDQTLLVTNARIVDVANGKLFGETALLIRGDRIERRLSAAEASGMGSDREIDAGGRYLIPGLINAHCHVTAPGVVAMSLIMVMKLEDQTDRNLVDCITHGVTTVRDQMGSQKSIVKRQERIGRGKLMGPRILRAIAIDVPGGYMTSGVTKLLGGGGSIVAKNDDQVRDAVSKAMDRGADHIKLALQYTSLYQGEEPIPTMTDSMLSTAVDAADSHGTYCAVHHTNTDGFRKALRAGIQSFEHMVSYLPIQDKDVQEFLDLGPAIVPTGSVAYALCFPLATDENFAYPLVQEMYHDKKDRMESLLDEFAVPALARLGKKVFKKYMRPGYFDKKHLGITPEARVFNSAGAVGGMNMMKMYKAGCRMGCGNDGGIPFVWPGSLPLEMYLNQRAGMKPADVLRMATKVNSEIIQMESDLGTLDPGKIADAVLLDLNPLADMENMQSTAATIQSGRLVFSAGEVAESGE